SDDYLYAIGHTGEIFLIAPDSGEIIARYPADWSHFCAPRIVGDALIIMTRFDLRAVPLERIHSSEPSLEVHLQSLRLQSLTELKPDKATRKQAIELTRRAPETPLAWQALADMLVNLPENL